MAHPEAVAIWKELWKQKREGVEHPMICDCCKKYSSCGMMDRFDNTTICDKCLSYVKGHFGFIPGKLLIKYIRQQKAKRWWQFWKN